MGRPSHSTDTDATASRSSISMAKAVEDVEVASSNTQTVGERAMNRRVNRKMDIALLPLLSLLYLFNGLDRGNVGNAQTQGFTNDIGAVPDDLNLAVSLFFITFILFQPPSAAIGRWLGGKHWIPVMMLGWGFVTLGQAFVKGRGSLIATRLLIGAFEAGFYPTAVAYLSFFYCRYDLAVRVGLFYGQYAVAGAFSGAISYGVFHLNHGPLKNWQYLFIIEGALTVLFGLVAWVLLPVGPGSAWFLTPAERRFAADRIRADNALFVEHTYDSDGLEEDRLTKRDFVETARDWKFWYVLAFNICASVPGQAFSVFLPLVVQGLGYSSIEANLMSVPPYVCGAVGLYCFTLSSDYHKERGYHILGGIMIALIGLIATVTVESHGGKYAALCVLLLGSYVAAPLTVAWLSGNTPEPGKRSLVLGLNGFGNISGIIGAQLYRAQYKPDYKIPFYATLGFVAAALVGYLSYRFTLAAVNRKKLEIMRHKSQEDIEKERVDGTRYADKKWTFIYGL
ncbi:Putative major facilitator superfamily, MFS transporter superfamily [Colletotrichum destructivum]|uniref:Major facilitator superfamily, MFS transporter superfamily n=1 Tax=Colletotrichum destructivum TaxID=34406 RepID=A0AAX4IYC4_9PEZI|nr:Putative major facilitator superfamily, MFS transporter superfamily [Colletotrichum destructivum]